MTVTSRPEFEFVDLPGRRAADPLKDVPSASSLRIVQMARIEGRRAHVHPHSEEVVVVAAGHGRAWIGGEWFSVATGDVVRIAGQGGPRHRARRAHRDGADLFLPAPEPAENIEDTDIE